MQALIWYDLTGAGRNDPQMQARVLRPLHGSCRTLCLGRGKVLSASHMAGLCRYRCLLVGLVGLWIGTGHVFRRHAELLPSGIVM